MTDIRWQQRFQFFQKAFLLLKDAVSQSELSVLERAGMIQFYEVAFELAWKTMKDFLKDQGYKELLGPRDVIKRAYQDGLIDDAEAWLEALNDRNITVHTYHEAIALKVEEEIRTKYFKLLTGLKEKLQSYL